MIKIMSEELENITVEHYLSGWEDDDRDGMRDFMNLMNWGFNFQLDKKPTPLEDELEYKDRVYKYYIWDRIFNHYLISHLINDREGRREIPLKEMSIVDLLKDINKQTTQTYNRYILNNTSNWNDKIEMNTDF
tara:strand:+ start:70 stop:468 length:399 start_codon:yes stop_codon:yes gene_type:complete